MPELRRQPLERAWLRAHLAGRAWPIERRKPSQPQAAAAVTCRNTGGTSESLARNDAQFDGQSRRTEAGL